ncbi:hypothetical protein [Streptomyces beijiangensis]|uniref:Uncharacterized protein n=1 Tax=Streptomyces beijiangensis TaxID=163361 RepID=A0A939JI89_9ACTN|nr:hypothetical protein [Streptomyces beijiangensis]MBO0515268.1 hypothetical protein [Streptomyces beijiangensis]
MKDGGSAAIAERAAEYVSDETWNALVKKHRRGGCDELAELARAILDGKKQLHALVGRAAGGLLGIFGRSRIERAYAVEFASRIPLPTDVKMAAAARALQIAGIYVCLLGAGDLSRCACLKDVFETEGKDRVKKLVQGAVEDWIELPRRLGDSGGGG